MSDEQPPTSVSPMPERVCALTERVCALTERMRALWWSCQDADLPSWLPVSATTQRTNQAALDRMVTRAVDESRTPPTSPQQRLALQERSLAAFGEFAQSTLGFQPRHLALLSNGFMPALAAFSESARRFDPAIAGADILQAGRNVSILNALQHLLGMPVQITPAITAYSLLYPYTDNYLDDPAVSAADKAALNQHLGQRLRGQPTAPTSERERAILALVDMIETQYPRRDYPELFESLMAIHRAQERSVGLVRPRISPYEVDVLGISLEKGGTSVLADGYITAGRLTPAQEAFMFGWGAFLQLADDLQDVHTDAHDGVATIFTLTARHRPLDGLCARTLAFGRHVLEPAPAIATPESTPLVELMQRSGDLLVQDAIGRAQDLLSRDFVRRVERCFPFRFSALSRARGQLARQRVSFMREIEGYASAAQDHWQPPPTPYRSRQ